MLSGRSTLPFKRQNRWRFDVFEHFEQISWRWCRLHWEWNFRWFKHLQYGELSENKDDQSQNLNKGKLHCRNSIILKRLGKFEDANSFNFCKLQLEWFSCLQKRELTSMRLARWTANHPRSRVFHFKLVLFNDSKKIPQAKTQSKANWTKRPLLYYETNADSTTLQMPRVLNRNKKGETNPQSQQ